VAWGLLLAPIALFDVRYAKGRATFDQVLFHEHTIGSMVDTWPIAKLTNPEHYVAMTPGFHWVMAGVSKATGLVDGGLRMAALLLCVAFFGVVGTMLGRRCGTVLGSLLMLPLLASVYVANSGAWLLADNAGWFWVAVLSFAAIFTRPSLRWSLLVALGLLLAVWTRQNLLFVALPLWVAAWLRSPPDGPQSVNPLVGVRIRAMNLLPLAIATLPAVLSLVYLYRIWGGLVPYEFQGQYDGVSPSNVALQLVMLATLGWFFLPLILGVGEPGSSARLSNLFQKTAPWMAFSGLLAGVVVFFVPTTYAPKEGRAGLAWSLMDRLNPLGPIGQTNLFVVFLAAIGAALLVFMLACVPPRRRWILGALFAGFAAAQVASSEVWQRYHEPFALLFLALLTAAAVRERGVGMARSRRLQVVPLAVLALGLSGATTVVLWQREIAPWRSGEPQVPVTPLLPEPPPRDPVAASPIELL